MTRLRHGFGVAGEWRKNDEAQVPNAKIDIVSSFDHSSLFRAS